MDGKLATMLVFLVIGCGGGEAASGPAEDASSRARAEAGAPSPPEDPALPPAETLKAADQLYDNQLAVGRDERFVVDRQVTELRRAILLYRQFIERAGDNPEMAAAVKKSRERIEDAERTIEFLAPKPSAP